MGELKSLFGMALCAALALAPPASAAEKMATGLLGSPNSGGWPYYIGIDKGYFAAAGLEPELIYVPTAPGLVQQLVAGSLDIVANIGVVEPIHAVAKGAAVAILRTTSGVTPYEMLAKPTIASVKALRGKTVCIGGLMDINRVFLDRIMQANGLHDGDYDIVVIGNTAQRFAALQSGAVDATMLVPPANFYAEKAGFTNIGMIMDYAKDLPMASADVSIAWAKAHRDAAQRLVAVLDQSIAWFYDDKNRGEAIDILVKVSHANRDEVAESYDFIRRIGMFDKSSGVSRTQLQHLIDAMRAIGDLKDTPVTPDQLVIAGLTRITP